MDVQGKHGFGRREFIGAAATALFAGIAIQITGCNKDDTGVTAVAGDGDLAGSISDNHPTPHRAIVTKAQLDAGGAVALDIQGAADHTHAVNLTADDMAALNAKQHVMTTSTSGGADSHSHMVMFN